MLNYKELFNILGILKPLDEIDILEGKHYKFKILLYSIIYGVWLSFMIFGFSYMIIIQGETQSSIELAVIGVVSLLGLSSMMFLSKYYSSKVSMILPDIKLKSILKKMKSESVEDSLLIRLYANSFRYLLYISLISVALGVRFGLQYDSFSDALYIISIGSVPMSLLGVTAAYRFLSIIFDYEIIYKESLLGLHNKSILTIYPSNKYGLVYCLLENEYAIYDKRLEKWIIIEVIIDKSLKHINKIKYETSSS